MREHEPLEPAAEIVVAVNHLSRTFGSRKALNDVSFTVPRGRVFGLVGENGAGKSTLIKHLLGLWRAETGTVRVFGLDPVAAPTTVLGRIGYLSEQPDLPGWMRVDELLRYMQAFYPRWDTDYAEALRTGLLFTLIRRSGDAGISSGALSRALLWIEDSKHAASSLEGSMLADFERVRASDPLLAEGAAESQATKLLSALETAKAITQDAKGFVRLRTGGSIPAWLPQTPTLSKLATIMRRALELVEGAVSATSGVEAGATSKAKRA